MKTIKLLPGQIRDYWDIIKYAAINTSGDMNDDNRDMLLNAALIKLMSGRLACFITINEKREVQNVVAVRIDVEDFTMRRTACITNVYAYNKTNLDQWKTVFDRIKEFAIKNNCTSIYGTTVNPRIGEIGNYIGLKLDQKIYRCVL